jgi:predicted PurR-regulated permease PerM
VVAVTDEAAAVSVDLALRAARFSRTSVALSVLAAIAVIGALCFASALLVPLLIGILASYTLRPVVDWLQMLRIPRPAAAVSVTAGLVGALSWVAVSLSDDATVMIEKLPDAARKLRPSLSDARSSGPTALQDMQEAASELQGAATDAGAKPGARAIAARATEPTAWLREFLSGTFHCLPLLIAGISVTLIHAAGRAPGPGSESTLRDPK